MQRFAQLLCCTVPEKEDEFIASVPCESVGCCQAPVALLHQGKQCLIPDKMAVGIIDLLEVVHIKQSEREREILGEGMSQDFLESLTIEKVGQAVPMDAFLKKEIPLVPVIDDKTN
jgi:hypothetical protein